MLAVAALAVNVHNGLAERSVGFAISYAAVRAVLALAIGLTATGVGVEQVLLSEPDLALTAAPRWLRSKNY